MEEPPMSSSLTTQTSSRSTSSSLIRSSPSEPISSPLIVLSSTVPTSSPLLMPSVSAVQSPTLVLSPIPQRNVSSCLSFLQFTLFPSSSPSLTLQPSTSSSTSLSPFIPLQPTTKTDLSVSPYPSPSLEPPVPIIAAGITGTKPDHFSPSQCNTVKAYYPRGYIIKRVHNEALTSVSSDKQHTQVGSGGKK